MPSPRVPIVETVSKAWIDTFHAIRTMPVVAVTALAIHFVIGIGVYFASMALLLDPGRTVAEWISSPAWFAFGLCSAALQIILLTPLMIAVHRYVIRGDIARRYPLNPLRPSYTRYVGMALAFYLAYRSADLISIMTPPAHALPFIFNAAIGVTTLLLMLGVIIVFLRRIALFPAIAANTSDNTWREITPADAGNVVRILVVLAGAILPAVMIGVLLHARLPQPNTAGAFVLISAMSLLQIPTLCAVAAATARIYLAIGKVAAPPNLVPGDAAVA
jgi:hypothetical protein